MFSNAFFNFEKYKVSLLKKLSFFFSCFGILLFFACQNAGEAHKTNVSFYHWKTNYTMGASEVEIFEKTGSHKLYLRFFDLKYDEIAQQVFPQATLQIKEGDTMPAEEIVPVIFIANKVFEIEKSALSIERLAKNTADKVLRLKNRYFANNTKFPGIQIDCDWSQSTRDAYFLFLKNLREQISYQKLAGENPNFRLSATLRLHQLKYFEKTGIPPVDKGILMAYNMGDLADEQETNSILNNEKASAYFGRLDEYPMDFDVAFPVFSWGVLYREGKLAGIINNLQINELQENFESTSRENFYKTKIDTYFKGNFIYQGDVIRWESVDPQDLQKLKNNLDAALHKEYGVILYHINSTNFTTRENEFLQIFN